VTDTPFHAFDVWGIEIEAMIVDAASLDVRPVADEALRDLGGGTDWVEDVDRGDIGWSNELVAHVLELKNVVPAHDLGALLQPFQDAVRWLDGVLQPRGARLMPGGMHPWMDPKRETRIWPHESAPIYDAYHAMFDCHRHGWANLQSVHLNLPFADEAEFGRLMAAVRVVLPWIPALSASSPFVEGKATGTLDNRLVTYRSNATRVPAMAGEVVPEPIFDYQGYRERVLAPITRQLAEIDADPELLEREWTNARGAIARFDRMAIEIRVIDAQECPAADLAVCAAVGGAVRAVYDQRWTDLAAQQAVPSAMLVQQLRDCERLGPATPVPPSVAQQFGADPTDVADAGALWRHLVATSFAGPAQLEPFVDAALTHGTLAQRLLRAAGPTPSRADLQSVYRELCECQLAGRSFLP